MTSAEEQEFEHVRKGLSLAADEVAKAVNEYGNGEWDYIIVAVPTGRPTTRIALMSSVPAQGLGMFIDFIHNAFAKSQKNGQLLTDEPSEGRPS